MGTQLTFYVKGEPRRLEDAMDKCRDCGDVLGTGSFCARCKWVSSGNKEMAK